MRPVRTALAATAAAGFTVARMLLVEPDDALLRRLADPDARRSWPLHNAATESALALLAARAEPEAVRAQWRELIGSGAGWRERDHAGPAGADVLGDLEQRYRAIGLNLSHVGHHASDHLGVQLTYLATRVGRAAPEQAGWHEDLAGFVGTHLGFATPALARLALRATTPPLRALPGLVTGFLDAVLELGEIDADRAS